MKTHPNVPVHKLVHPTAIIDPEASLHPTVAVGPYSIVEAGVILKEGVSIGSHVHIQGDTEICENTKVHSFCSLGDGPQSIRFRGEGTRLVIGKENVIREHVTIHRGTIEGGGLTSIGDKGFFMVACHIAHDCHIGDGVIMANNATLGGHVSIGNFANIGGLSAVHQYVRIGQQAMIGGMSGVDSDVIPYGMVKGDRAYLAGLNVIGLKRRGFSSTDIHTLRSAYRCLFAPEGTLSERLTDATTLFEDNEIVEDIVQFISKMTERSLCLPKDISG